MRKRETCPLQGKYPRSVPGIMSLWSCRTSKDIKAQFFNCDKVCHPTRPDTSYQPDTFAKVLIAGTRSRPQGQAFLLFA